MAPKNIQPHHTNLIQEIGNGIKQYFNIGECFRDYDSLWFECTKSYFQGLLKQFSYTEFKPKKNKLRFSNPFDVIRAQDKGLETKGYRIDRIRIIAYSSSTLFRKDRKNHKKLGSKIRVGLHGIFQYKSNGERRECNKAILEYFLKNKKSSKLVGLDYAFDFREKIEISPENIFLKIPALKKFENQVHQIYKTTLYIQNQVKDSYQLPLVKNKKASLQKICIYDKGIKNFLRVPLTRFEFRVWFDKAGQKSYK